MLKMIELLKNKVYNQKCRIEIDNFTYKMKMSTQSF